LIFLFNTIPTKLIGFIRNKNVVLPNNDFYEYINPYPKKRSTRALAEISHKIRELAHHRDHGYRADFIHRYGNNKAGAIDRSGRISYKNGALYHS